MQDFFENVSRYPRYFVTIILGIFFSFFGWLSPFMKNRVTAVALISAFVASFAFLYFTLRAMLGLTPA